MEPSRHQGNIADYIDQRTMLGANTTESANFVVNNYSY